MEDMKKFAAIQSFPMYRPETIKSEEMENVAALKGRLFREKVNPKVSKVRVLTKCNDCKEIFASPAMLRKHRVLEHGDEPKHKCDICFAVLASKQSLNRHLDSHNKVQAYQCKMCLKDFTHEASLVRHIRYMHTRERPHKCPVCNYTAVEHAKLQVHMRSHTGESPYTCVMCGMGFKASIALKRHALTHTGEKDYLCVLCFLQFRLAGALKAHMKLIHSAERQKHMTTIKTIQQDGIPPTFKLYLNKVNGGNFNDESIMHLRYFDIRDEYANDLHMFHKIAPVLVDPNWEMDWETEATDEDGKRAVITSVTKGQLHRMALGSNPKVKKMYHVKEDRKSTYKQKIKCSPYKRKIKCSPASRITEGEVQPINTLANLSAETEEQSTEETVGQNDNSFSIAKDDRGVDGRGIDQTGVVEEEIEYEIQYVGNTEDTDVTLNKDTANQNGDDINSSGNVDKDICNPVDNCIALTEVNDVRECTLSNMRQGFYGANPHVIKVLEDGTVIDVTSKYKQYLPVTTST